MSAHHLEAPAICEHAPLPVHELMQSSHAVNQVGAWPVGQMVCIAQNHMAVQFFQLKAGKAFHTACNEKRDGLTPWQGLSSRICGRTTATDAGFTACQDKTSASWGNLGFQLLSPASKQCPPVKRH